MHVCKHLPLLRCVLCYILCLTVTVISVCTTVNLRHWVRLVPLFGSVYITVLNCVCYVMFIWWFVFYYMHCPAWQILCNPAFVLQYNKTIIIIIQVARSHQMQIRLCYNTPKSLLQYLYHSIAKFFHFFVKWLDQNIQVVPSSTAHYPCNDTTLLQYTNVSTCRPSTLGIMQSIAYIYTQTSHH